MWERLTELLERIGFLPEETVKKEPKIERQDEEDPAMEFRSLDPSQAAALGLDVALVCPVTRQSLPQGNLFYLCRDCNTAYSAEGWDFLRQMDKGRCCHCRHTGSVILFRKGGTPF